MKHVLILTAALIATPSLAAETRPARPVIGAPCVTANYKVLWEINSTNGNSRSSQGIGLSLPNLGAGIPSGMAVFAKIGSVSGEGWKADIDRLCALGRDGAKSETFFRYHTVMPGQSGALSKVLTDKGTVLDLTALTASDFKGIAEPAILGCAVYGDGDGSAKIYQTGFFVPLQVEGDTVRAESSFASKAD